MEPCRPLGLLAIEDPGDDQHGNVEALDRRGDGFVDVDRDVEQSDIERLVVTDVADVADTHLDAFADTVGHGVRLGRWRRRRIEVDPDHICAELGCGDCENAAPGPEVDDAVAGPDVLGERSQHQASRGVTAAAEGMPRVDHQIDEPAGGIRIDPGWTNVKAARPVVSRVVSPVVESGRVGDVLYPPAVAKGHRRGGGGVGECRPDRAVDLLHTDSTSTPEFVDEKFGGRVIVGTNDRDQVMHPQSSCWRRKRSNSAARSSALGILDSARRS